MILGIGTDLIEIERIKKACQKEAFFVRIYTDKERELFRNSPASLAGNFAVKEAVSKALGCGFRDFSPHDIEVLRDCLGKPYVNLYHKAEMKCIELGITSIHVSISHSRDCAAAFAIAEGSSS